MPNINLQQNRSSYKQDIYKIAYVKYICECKYRYIDSREGGGAKTASMK